MYSICIPWQYTTHTQNKGCTYSLVYIHTYARSAALLQLQTRSSLNYTNNYYGQEYYQR